MSAIVSLHACKPQRSSNITGSWCKNSLRVLIFYRCTVHNSNFSSTLFWCSNSVVWDIVLPAANFLLNLFNGSFAQLIFHYFVVVLKWVVIFLKTFQLCLKSTKQKFVLFRQVIVLDPLWLTNLVSSIFYGDCVLEHLHYQIISFLINIWFYSNCL